MLGIVRVYTYWVKFTFIGWYCSYCILIAVRLRYIEVKYLYMHPQRLCNAQSYTSKSTKCELIVPASILLLWGLSPCILSHLVYDRDCIYTRAAHIICSGNCCCLPCACIFYARLYIYIVHGCSIHVSIVYTISI